MMLKAFCLLDQKTGVHHAPIFFNHRGLAIRAAVDLGSDLSTSVGRHPHDYRLLCVGEFDDTVGRFFQSEVLEDFGTVGSILAAYGSTFRPVDPATATASEIIAARENGEV